MNSETNEPKADQNVVEYYGSPNSNPKSFVKFDHPYRIHEFVDALNEQHITKFTGSPFKYTDVIGYIANGYMPYAYGGWKVTSEKVRSELFVTMKREQKQRYGMKPLY